MLGHFLIIVDLVKKNYPPGGRRGVIQRDSSKYFYLGIKAYSYAGGAMVGVCPGASGG